MPDPKKKLLKSAAKPERSAGTTSSTSYKVNQARKTVVNSAARAEANKAMKAAELKRPKNMRGGIHNAELRRDVGDKVYADSYKKKSKEIGLRSNTRAEERSEVKEIKAKLKKKK
jgi:hypothetical protein